MSSSADPTKTSVPKPIKHNIHSFINCHLVEKGCEFTHTSMGDPKASFYVPADELDTFYKLYEKALAEKQDLYITEKNRHIGPFLIDIDLRFKGDSDVRVYDYSFIQRIVQEYAKVLSKYLIVPQNTKIYVMEKSKPLLIKGNTVKDGLHIIIPGIVTKASVKYLVRLDVMTSLAPIMKCIGCCNEVRDIIDESIIEKNNWLMYGSMKKGGEPYQVTHIFKFTDDTGNVAHVVSTDRLNPEKFSTYPQLFSLRNKHDETHIAPDMVQSILGFESRQEEKKRNTCTEKKIVMQDLNRRQCHYENIDQIDLLLTLLDKGRAVRYEDWIRLGWCLRNIDNRLIVQWEQFSKHCDKYKHGECEKIWDHMKEGGLHIGTLHMWAKHDNPAGYKELMKNDLKTLLYQSVSMAHFDIAKVIYQLYSTDFVCSSFKNKTWYEFRDHRWVLSDSGLSLRIKFSEEVWRVYKNEAVEFNQKAISSNNQSDQDQFSKISRKMDDISQKLRNSTFKESIMKECSELFYQEKFEDKLDSNTNLIGFMNGVFDLEMNVFRPGRPDDYISFSTNINYIPYDPTHGTMLAINEYLAQVLVKPTVREYVLKLFGTFINGNIKEQKFYIWTGTGSNSKSMLVELFEKSFGEYCCKFPITLLTQKRCASNAANTELARAKGKRFACLQEPSEDEKINIGLMKELSGGDKIMARAIYKEPVEFNPQFKMLLLCNQLPDVPGNDGGTWRRIRVVEFTSKFVDCPSPDDENEFQIDYDLGEKMQDWREHFMSLLIHYYNKYKTEGITEPAEVMNCTTDYKLQNDHLQVFLDSCIQEKKGAFASMDDMHNEMKRWIRADEVPMKNYSKAELQRILNGKIGKRVKCEKNEQGIMGFKGYAIRSAFPDESEKKTDNVDKLEKSDSSSSEEQ
jgi:P4 family phage/plasmid primase-like protien